MTAFPETCSRGISAAPLNLLEQALHGMVAEIIHTADFGITDNLRDLGLSSLSGLRLSVEVYKKFGVNLNAGNLISDGTIQSIENEILAELLSRKLEDTALPSGQRESSEPDDYPLSMTQAGIFVDSMRFADSTVYNTPFLYRLDDAVDMERLRAALSIAQKWDALFSELGVKAVRVEEAVPSHSRENLNVPLSWESLCYVIYTSGSTGRPKGVMLTNHNLVNFVDGDEKNREIQMYTKHGQVSLVIAALTFDVSVMEEFLPLANGMTVVLATKEQTMNPAALSALMLETQVDVMVCTPSYLSNLLMMESALPAIARLKAVDVGAEAFPEALFGALKKVNPDLCVMNGYGPTETTISCTVEVLKQGGDITIGTPNVNVHVATLDRGGRLQPLGAMGEMVILGDGVGRGYVGREDLTEKSFIRLLGKPAYRSGDLARLRADGKIEFHGRMDNQVKLRSLRIELGEVESVLILFAF